MQLENRLTRTRLMTSKLYKKQKRAKTRESFAIQFARRKERIYHASRTI